MIAHRMGMGGLPWAVIKNNKKEMKKDPSPYTGGIQGSVRQKMRSETEFKMPPFFISSV